MNLDMIKSFLEIEVDESGKKVEESLRENKKLFAGGEIVVDIDINEKKICAELKISK